MQDDTHVFQGMKKGAHPIKLDSNFLWEAHNVRLTNREDNTLFSITNEKGTKDTGLSFDGIYLGHCVLGKYLVVFTAERKGNSYIYRVEKNDDDTFTKVILFKGKDLLDPDYPIEALGNVETEYVLKVYWVDGKHLPRYINITLPELKNWGNQSDYSFLYEITHFDFIPDLKLKEQVSISKKYGNGQHLPGTIQYAFTYYNKYGAESNIFYTTPIYYVSHLSRGDIDNSIAISFTINIENLLSFEYVRVYSITRTSLQGQASVKVVKDVPILVSEDSITIEDDGTAGYNIDPSLLLYIGGKSIIAKCIDQKDNTLFLGNILLKNNNIKDVLISIPSREDEHGNIIYESTNLSNIFRRDDISEGLRHIEISNTGNNFYDYSVQLKTNTQTFKGGEWYRLGVLFLYKDGTWTDPFYVTDYTVNTHSVMYDNYLSLPILKNKIRKEAIEELVNQGYKNMRGVIVYPDKEDRKILALGMLCPTIFNAKDRMYNSPYSQASWLLRPFSGHITKDTTTSKYGEFARSAHLSTLGFIKDSILSSEIGLGTPFRTINLDISNNILDDLNDKYYIDLNILTFHSPDIDFDGSLYISEDAVYKLKIIGLINFTSSISDIDIITSTPTYNSDAIGFVKPSVAITNIDNNGLAAKNIISGPFYNDSIVKKVEKDDKYKFELGDVVNHMVYLWDSGSLNNDIKRPEGEGTRTALLLYKKISNLKFSRYITWLQDLSKEYNVKNILLFNSNEVSLIKLKAALYNKNMELTYYGNVDSACTYTPEPYAQYTKEGVKVIEHVDAINDDATIEKTSITRLKYKSTPHIVLTLGDDNKGRQIILPSVNGKNKVTFDNPLFWNKTRNTGSDTPEPDTPETNFNTKVAYVINSDDHTPTPSYSLKNLIPESIRQNIKTNDLVIQYLTSVNSRSQGYLYLAVNDGDNYVRVLLNGNNVNNIYEYTDSDRTVYLYLNKYLGNGYFLLLIDTIYPSDDSLPSGNYLYLDNINIETNYPYLFLAELYRKEENIVNAFGGSDETALLSNLWLPAGDVIPLENYEEGLDLVYKYGDTWYQRYDCLKTYPFTHEDENQLVEIGSFMCETRINIDGRYDRNRGQLSNLNMSPLNFNLINYVYSQKDNFFTYRILPKDFYKQNEFKNLITWSKEKIAGEDVDTWTNVTLANTLDLDGSKGEITAIKSFNELLVAFQEQAISKINFNSRVQIPVSDGVPIEIANSYKVDGYDIYSNIIGCQDKNSIINTEDGIYFIDNNSNSLYKFNGQLSNISDTLGMKSWFKDNKFNYKWKPIPGALNKNNGIRSFYDYENGDIYFTPGWDNIDKKYTTRDALCYSNKLLAFSSLMSYGGTLAMFNYCGDFYSLRYNPNDSEEKIKLYLNNAGDYNDFYGETKGWDFSFISNDGSAVTKVFDTLELRTDVYNSSKELLNSCPMNFIKVDNEYLNTGEVTLDRKNMRKKFRIWRGLIPRNKGTRERIRNPWTKITLGWNPLLKQESENSNNSAIIHDVTVRYTV